MEALDVSAVRQSNDIEVSITGRASTERHRVDLAEIATAVAEAFVEETRMAASAGRKETIDKLEEERKLLDEELQIVRTRMETIRKTNIDVVDMRERAGALNATLTATVSNSQPGKMPGNLYLLFRKRKSQNNSRST